MTRRESPTELDGGQRKRVALHDGGNEGQGQGHHVDGQLELQELADVLVHAAPPQDGLDNGVKVVVQDDDV